MMSLAVNIGLIVKTANPMYIQTAIVVAVIMVPITLFTISYYYKFLKGFKEDIQEIREKFVDKKTSWKDTQKN